MAADVAEKKRFVELRPHGQAGPALGQDTEKATKWAAGPKTRLCDQITSRNLHGNFTGFYKVFSGARGGAADLAEQKTLVELRPDLQAGPALGQNTEKATKRADGPKKRLCDQIASRNLHGNFTGFYKVFSGARGGAADLAEQGNQYYLEDWTRKRILLGGRDQETNTTW